MYKLVVRQPWFTYAGIALVGLIIIIFVTKQNPDWVFPLPLLGLIALELVITQLIALLCYQSATLPQITKIGCTFMAIAMGLGAISNLVTQITQLLPNGDLIISWVQLALMNLTGMIATLAVYELQPLTSYASDAMPEPSESQNKLRSRAGSASSAVRGAAPRRTNDLTPAQAAAAATESDPSSAGAAGDQFPQPGTASSLDTAKSFATQSGPKVLGGPKKKSASFVRLQGLSAISKGSANISFSGSVDGVEVTGLKSILDRLDGASDESKGKSKANVSSQLVDRHAPVKGSPKDKKLVDIAGRFINVMKGSKATSERLPQQPTVLPTVTPSVAGSNFQKVDQPQKVEPPQIQVGDGALSTGSKQQATPGLPDLYATQTSTNSSAVKSTSEPGNVSGSNAPTPSQGANPKASIEARMGLLKARSSATISGLARVSFSKIAAFSQPDAITGQPATSQSPPGAPQQPVNTNQLVESSMTRSGTIHLPGPTVSKPDVGAISQERPKPDMPVANPSEQSQSVSEIKAQTTSGSTAVLGSKKATPDDLFSKLVIAQAQRELAAEPVSGVAEIPEVAPVKDTPAQGNIDINFQPPEVEPEAKKDSATLFESKVDDEIDQIFSTIAPAEAQRDVHSPAKELVDLWYEPSMDLQKEGAQLTEASASLGVTTPPPPPPPPPPVISTNEAVRINEDAPVHETSAQGGLLGADVYDAVDDLFAQLVPPEAQREVGNATAQPVSEAQTSPKPVRQSETDTADDLDAIRDSEGEENNLFVNPVTNVREVREFGRLAKQTPQDPSLAPAPGAMKTIGKLLLDKDAIANVIKSGEEGQIGSGLANTRIISAIKGEGINELLTTIDGCQGVRGNLIVGHDGLVISSSLAAEFDRDTIGALSIALLSTSNLITSKLEIGSLRQMVLLTKLPEKNEIKDFATILTDVEVGILATFVDTWQLNELDSLLQTIDETIHG